MQVVESKGHCLIQSIWRLEYNSFEQVSSHKFTFLPLEKHMEKSWSFWHFLWALKLWWLKTDLGGMPGAGTWWHGSTNISSSGSGRQISCHFMGAKFASTLLLIFFVAGTLCSVADHWVHILPLQNSSQSQNFDIHKYLNNHGKFWFTLQQCKILLVGVLGKLGFEA